MEEVQHGEPRTMECILKDELVSEAFIGQRKQIIGIFRSQAQRGKDTNRPFIHVMSMKDLSEEKLVLPTDDDIKYYQSLQKKLSTEEWFDMLTKSFAPEIKFRDLEKLCLIIGRLGAVKDETHSDKIHVLLIGDPSTGKSKMLEFLHDITQRCGFAVGGTSTGSGVTVTMTMMPNKTKMPKAGIVPLCSGSGVVIDEVNQLTDEDLGKLYESMASQRIHYNKGGFELDFIADTAIWSGANPKAYRYNKDVGMLTNIRLPLPLISRYDLIVNLTGSQFSSMEQQSIYDHIDKIDREGISSYIQQNKLLHADQLQQLLNYMSTQLQPKFTDKSSKLLKEFFFSLKQMEDPDENKPFDERFNHSIRKVAKAVAKLHFSETVTEEHIAITREIISKTLNTFGVKTEKELEHMQMGVGQDKETIFAVVCKLLQKEKNTDYLLEEDILVNIQSKYPDVFKTERDAENIWKKVYEKGHLEKKGGRYKYVA
jgi:DNA replicative helicase MCM subunit Mcm2 (Cdc46/Mcm family)